MSDDGFSLRAIGCHCLWLGAGFHEIKLRKLFPVEHVSASPGVRKRRILSSGCRTAEDVDTAGAAEGAISAACGSLRESCGFLCQLNSEARGKVWRSQGTFCRRGIVTIVIPPFAKHFPTMEEGTGEGVFLSFKKNIGLWKKPSISIKLANAFLLTHRGSNGEYFGRCLGSPSGWLRKGPWGSDGEPQARHWELLSGAPSALLGASRASENKQCE